MNEPLIGNSEVLIPEHKTQRPITVPRVTIFLTNSNYEYNLMDFMNYVCGVQRNPKDDLTIGSCSRADE